MSLDLAPSGKTPSDQTRAANINRYFDGLEDFRSPFKLTVDGDVITLWYIDFYGTDTSDVDEEVETALGGPQAAKDWLLVYRDLPSGRIFSTVKLPVSTQGSSEYLDSE